MNSIYEIEIKNRAGKMISMEKYKGQVILVVNTASNCSLATQFTGLQKLHRKYKKEGLVVLAFPTLDFRKEFKKGKDAKNFCQSKYGVEFTILDTVFVNGKNQEPLFKHLKSNKRNKVGIKKIVYNFTKFLIDRNGNVVARFGASKTPEQIENEIITLLEQKC